MVRARYPKRTVKLIHGPGADDFQDRHVFLPTRGEVEGNSAAPVRMAKRPLHWHSSSRWAVNPPLGRIHNEAVMFGEETVMIGTALGLGCIGAAFSGAVDAEQVQGVQAGAILLRSKQHIARWSAEIDCLASTSCCHSHDARLLNASITPRMSA